MEEHDDVSGCRIDHRRAAKLCTIARVFENGTRLLPSVAVRVAAAHVDYVGRAVSAVHAAIDKGQKRAVGCGNQRRDAVVATREAGIELAEEVLRVDGHREGGDG